MDSSFEDLWDKLLRGTGGKALGSENEITMTTAEFRRLMRISYESGMEDGKHQKSMFERVFGISKLW